jgi:hypothetical protein
MRATIRSGACKKNELKPHLKQQWVIPPQASSAFVAAMEDVLAVYKRPRDEDCPLVCLDETSKQLLAHVHAPIPMKPGQPGRHDYEYERNGTANLFMMFAPLEGWRHIEVTDRRTAIDYAHALEANANNVTIQFNEVYHVQPISYTTGCDWAAYDLDGGTSNSILQYNYAHDDWGPSILLFESSTSYVFWGNNVARFNVSENDNQSGGLGDYGDVAIGGGGGGTIPYGPMQVFDNTLYMNARSAIAFMQILRSRRSRMGLRLRTTFAM